RLAVELRPEATELRGERALQPDHPLDRLLRDLVRRVLVREQHGLPVQKRVDPVALDGLAEPPVRLGAREPGADSGLQASALLLPLLIAGHVQLLLGLVGRALQRGQLLLEPGDQLLQLDVAPAHAATASLSASITRS